MNVYRMSLGCTAFPSRKEKNKLHCSLGSFTRTNLSYHGHSAQRRATVELGSNVAFVTKHCTAEKTLIMREVHSSASAVLRENMLQTL